MLDGSSNILELLGRTESLFCSLHLSQFEKASSLPSALEQYCAQRGLDVQMATEYVKLGISEDLVLQHWINPADIFWYKVYRVNPQINNEIKDSEHRELQQEFRGRMQIISRKFSETPEHRQEYEVLKSKLPRVRALLREHMHSKGYFLTEEAEDVSFFQALKSGLKLFETGVNPLLKQNMGQLFEGTATAEN